jgi:hypothetical protein
MSFGTLLTLFEEPVAYSYLPRSRHEQRTAMPAPMPAQAAE